MHRLLKITATIFFTATFSFGQQPTTGFWHSFTDMKSIRSAVNVNENIWAATNGGVFSFDTINGSYARFTNTEGLDTNDVYAIAYDGTENIWVGGAGGWINIFNLSTRQWKNINDIVNNSSTNKNIKSFLFKGDTVFVVTEFSVAVFKLSAWEFGDTYINIGFPSSPKIKCAAVYQDHIWIGTDLGLATASLSNPNVWTVYTSFPGITSSAVNKLTVFDDVLIVGTDRGIVAYAGGIFNALGSFIGRNIQDLNVSKGKLLVLSSSGSDFIVHNVPSISDIPELILSNNEVKGTVLVPASSIWIGTISNGLASMTTAGWRYQYPNCPKSNFFNSLAVDADGVLWCGSSESGAGFYRYNPSLPDSSRWKNFTSDKYPIMRKDGNLFDSYYRVSLGSNGSVWVSSWGDGVIEVKGDTVKRKINYPDLNQAGSDPRFYKYTVGGAAAVDDQGRTWITARSGLTTNTLIRMENDSIIQTSPILYNNFHDIIVDQNGTKWIANSVPWHTSDPSNGLFYFNENKILPGTATTGGWGKITGMNSDLILSLAVDHDGSVWAGSALGIVIIPNTRNPQLYSISWPMREQTVQSIAVDAVNNKWVATKDGVYVLNADGTQIISEYTVGSTDKNLLARDVRAVAIDQKRGIAYFGTEQGLSSFALAPLQPERSISELAVGPNPFILPSEQPLTISKLVANSTIKIVTVNGTFVTQFAAQNGGRGFWDGRDKTGRFVSSGIYFIVAFAENGTETVVGKVAVIRR